MSAVPQISTGGIDVLLDRLEGVKRAGKGYRARCPSCGGKSQKVSITEADSGAVLLHAFCGCSPAQVLDAVGLPLGALFPTRVAPTTPEERRAAGRAWRESQWGAALAVLELEATIVLVAARQVAAGQQLDHEDDRRLAAAVSRIEDARGVLRGR